VNAAYQSGDVLAIRSLMGHGRLTGLPPRSDGRAGETAEAKLATRLGMPLRVCPPRRRIPIFFPEYLNLRKGAQFHALGLWSVAQVRRDRSAPVLGHATVHQPRDVFSWEQPPNEHHGGPASPRGATRCSN
jgi:hypothetical protein